MATPNFSLTMTPAERLELQQQPRLSAPGIKFDYESWEVAERLRFVRGVVIWGTDFDAIAETICLKEA